MTNQKNLTYRNKNIDIMRGLAIILVVLSHTGNPFGRWFVSYFVQLFFMIAGWLWKDTDTDNLTNIKVFMIKSIKRLYLPCTLASIISVFCNNLFIKINFLTINPSFLETAAGQRYGLAKYYMMSDIVNGMEKSLLAVSPPHS